MKRLISILIMIVLVLTGCAQTETKEETTEVEMVTEESEEPIQSEKVSNDTYKYGIVGLDKINEWKEGKVKGDELQKYLDAVGRKLDEVEPADDNDKNAISILKTYFYIIGSKAKDIDDKTLPYSDESRQVFRDEIDEHIKAIEEQIYQ